MARTISVGIDIGTHHVKVAIAEHIRTKEQSARRIIGTGTAESRGMRYGYIINSADVTRSIKTAVHTAEEAAHVEVKSALISIGGIGLENAQATGSVVISRADSEITELDVERAQSASESALPPAATLNRKIIHAIPIQYKIDGKEVMGRPAGMKGMKLEVKMFFITCLEQHLRDIVQAVEDADVEVEDVIAAPVAAAFVNLSKAQKIAGSLLANIGAETVSLIVYENDVPISLKVFPIGSTDITNDIALGLRIPIDAAEQVKLKGVIGGSYPRKQLEEIIFARLTDIFELIEAHLKKIGKNGLLPAGIVLTGGGASIGTIEDLAKASLKLPSRIATIEIANNGKAPVKDASWSVAFGLCFIGLSIDRAEVSSGLKLAHRARHNFTEWVKQFLP